MKTILILTLALLVSLIGSAKAQVQVLPPNFTLFGKTSGEYLAELDQYLTPLSTNGDYLLPKAVPSSTEPVYFLQRPFFGVPPPVGIQTYFVPDDVYVFLPIVHFAFDNVGNDPPWTVGQLRDALDIELDGTTAMRATIDGVALTNLFAYRTESPVFSMFFPTNDNIYTVYQLGVLFEGLDDPVVAAGYPLMLAPLPVGLHDFRTGFTVVGGINSSFERHYQINVFHANHPPVADASATVRRVISPNNYNARVVLDGSRSSDPDHDPLSYVWLDGDSVIGAGTLSTNVLPIGPHVISLIVRDGQLTDTNAIPVEVITPCQAVSKLVFVVQATDLPHKRIKSLMEELKGACAAFEHGFRESRHDREEHIQHAIDELREFQHEAKKELRQLDQNRAGILIDGAQEIINAVSIRQQHQSGEEDEDRK